MRFGIADFTEEAKRNATNGPFVIYYLEHNADTTKTIIYDKETIYSRALLFMKCRKSLNEGFYIECSRVYGNDISTDSSFVPSSRARVSSMLRLKSQLKELERIGEE